MSLEVEQKFPAADSGAVAQRLDELGAHEGGIVTQVDQYFAHPSRDFAQTDEALRIRRVGDGNYITYKGPKLDSTTKTRREIELPLDSGAAAAESFGQLLEALGFRPVAEVRKQRRKLSLDWQGHTFEAALDEVSGLGTFVELELITEEGGLTAAKAALASLVAALDLAGSERRSYLELLLEKQGGTTT